MWIRRPKVWVWLLQTAFIGNMFFAVTAHAATELKRQWLNPEYDAAPLQDAIVLVLIRYPEVQRSAEDEVVAHLRAHGVMASPSYRTMPPELSAYTSTDDARRVIERSGASVALVIRLLDPGQPYAIVGVQVDPAEGGFYDWMQGWNVRPSSYREFTSEARLFNVARGQLIWIGTFETRGADRNAAKTSRECTEELIKALAGLKLFKPRS